MSCADVRERAPEVALGILGGGERAEVLHHLSGCARCQATVDEHSEVADLLLHAAPAIEPPDGFEARVVRAARADRRRTLRRLVVAVAAAAAAAAITSVGIVRVIDADRTDDRVAAAPELRSVPMVGADGVTVGRVTLARSAPAALVVSVDYAVADGTYELRLRGGSSDLDEELGTMTISDGRGEWGGRATISDGDDVRVVLVAPDGTAVCEAELV